MSPVDILRTTISGSKQPLRRRQAPTGYLRQIYAVKGELNWRMCWQYVDYFGNKVFSLLRSIFAMEHLSGTLCIVKVPTSFRAQKKGRVTVGGGGEWRIFDQMLSRRVRRCPSCLSLLSYSPHRSLSLTLTPLLSSIHLPSTLASSLPSSSVSPGAVAFGDHCAMPASNLPSL